MGRQYDGEFCLTFYDPDISVCSVEDGSWVTYDGDPLDITPVMTITGKYSDFAILETPILGCLTRGTRVATNVYECIKAANGKSVLQFGARFDAHEIQALDGYAYQIAIKRANQDFGYNLESLVSTNEQASWWDGVGGGTMSHSYIACFGGDTVEATLKFAEILPPEIKRISLVDFHNDCLQEAKRAALAMYGKYKATADKRFKLFGVRVDTSGDQRDISVPANVNEPFGVNPTLIVKLRNLLDKLNERDSWDNYFRDIKIIVSGGFNPKKIRQFEKLGLPVDAYGVGSYLLENGKETKNDFTADITEIKFDDENWQDCAKVGRRTCYNDNLRLVK